MKRFYPLILLGLLCGCVVTSGSRDSKDCSDDESSATLDIGPMIGLIGLAVDGDDKDDYDKFFDDDDDCRCRR